MLLLHLSLLLSQRAPQITIRLEAETATLSGPRATEEAGIGFVTGFIHGNDWVTWRYPADRPGIYDLTIGYRAGNPKGYDLKVNGHGPSGMLTATGSAFGKVEAGKIELQKGENEIALGKGWGYYDIDYIELRPSKPFPLPHRPPARLCDPKATPHAVSLFKRLVSAYGKRTFTGQYGQADTDFVKAKVGVIPAIFGGDLIDYSPSRVEHGADAKQEVEKMIDQAGKGAILTLSWHWNAPTGLLDKRYKNDAGKEIDASWYRGFYTEATTFDVAKALADESSEEYRLILRDIDAIAVQLKRFADRDIPILWRPLHEAEGGWFWWGAKGPEPQKRLWRLMYDRLTNRHGLHNLIWVYNSSNPDWYPGDDVVDVMSVDRYPADRTDPLTVDWAELQKRFDGRKMLAVAEFPGAPDVERMYRLGARWAYFVSWTNTLGARGTDPALLSRTYRSRKVINR